jgi:xanthine dehydrogenase YagS FAD-binding subunit
MKNFDYYLPETAAEARAVATEIGAAPYKAGGTDLLTLLKEGLSAPEAIINLPGAAELRGIQEDDEKFAIGAMTTLAEIGEHEALRRWAPAVAEAAGTAATPLIRAQATLGGNLCQRPRCWYFRSRDYDCAKKGGTICYTMDGENKYHAIFGNEICCIVHPSNLAPALWAHDARIHVLSAKGAKKEIPIADFWVRPEQDMSTEVALGPGDLVTGVSFEPAESGAGSAYVEAREKQSFDWALVAAAARIELDGSKVTDVRICVSAVAPVPMRVEKAEAALRGQTWSEERARKAGAAAVEGATPLRDNGYKTRMLQACVIHALTTAHERAKAS